MVYSPGNKIQKGRMEKKQTGLPALYRYQFTFVTERPVRLSPYTGSMWRGLLGHGLRKAACVTKEKTCEGCLLVDSCVYNRVFETRVRQTGQTRGNMRPHPFVIEVQPTPDDPQENIGFVITLFESAHDALPYIVYGMTLAGQLGVGRENTRFELADVKSESLLGSEQWQAIWLPEEGKLISGKTRISPAPLAPDSIVVSLETPLRIKQRGKLVGPAEFESAHFLRQLWHRADDVQRYYSGGVSIPLPKEKPDQMPMLEKAIRWQDWKRYSSRQKTAMNMGGLVGKWRMEGERLAQWWPLVWYGQWLHLGKATSMGLGRYRVTMA